ncbi:putative Zn-dependent peptidase [Antricoccus suffuscus]|uniref:Putative Zn-dependent peptidase n=1 Tax=Antricoccus suffuscus TaxID=1629062 RepID=A0A2T0ZQB6_9ACTN|nr:pitrilysin family protein [Antricoccus suffuscus]PRZ38549.1 putative Zn-dependent peptidase [Antricoccus suffuscus]
MRSPDYEIHRMRLANGLRVVLAPEKNSGAVAISVHYDVGMRSEPEGRTGFAHLFEHLMFEGSANVPTHEHAKYIQGVGGSFNGSTHPDYTEYHEVLPPHALERCLFLEADRMRAPLLTHETMQNQISVVKEEIRVNVLNRPYGGFPWLAMPPVLFDTFANAHNGYGDFVDLETATVDDARAFFARYYAPGNAVLTVAGDFELAAASDMIERHFADIPARRVPKLPSFAEPAPTNERHGSVTDAHAPIPATALGWQSPDPVDDLDGYLPTVILCDVLYDGDASRLHDEIVTKRELALAAFAYCGTFGDPFDQRGANTVTVQFNHPRVDTRTETIALVDDIIGQLATDGPTEAEMQRVLPRMVSQFLREMDSTSDRGLRLGTFELLYGRAELANELPGLLDAVEPQQVAKAAASLTPSSRAVVCLEAKETA